MRLWIVSQNAYPPCHSSGTRHWALSRQLIERGHDVTVIATSLFHSSREEMRLPPGEDFMHEIIEGVPFCWVRSSPYKGNSLGRVKNMASFAWRIWRECGLRHLPRPDVIIGSSPPLFGAYAAQKLARRYDVPFVAEIRDLWPETFVSFGHASRWHPFVRLCYRIERKLYENADAIITLLPGSQPYIEAHGGRGKPIDWLPNGVDLSLVPQVSETTERSPFTLMYAGAHGIANNLDYVLDAAKMLAQTNACQEVRMKLVGEGPEKERLQKRAADERIHNVEFLPPVPKQDVYQLLQSADAFLMVLQDSPVFRWGVSPNKLFDYLVSGRPVLFSVSADVNLVEQAKAGISVTPDDVQALTSGIQQLVALPLSERQAMGSRGRRLVVDNYDFCRLAERMEMFLSTLLPSHKARVGKAA